jgi:mRNA-degrading endonuclease RelE of RelBE toxin-antitoxin system
MFKLDFREKALKILSRIPKGYQLKINSALDDLKLGKFTALDIKRIGGTKYGHRLRVGRWRVLFSLFPNEKRIEIVDIFLKKEKENYGKRKHLLK